MMHLFSSGNLSGLTLAQAVPSPAAGGGGDFLGGIFPMVVIFVIFYIFLIVPQQKKAKEHQKMLNELKKGDRVLLTGGIYGNIANVKGDIAEVKISDGVTVEVAKHSISSVIPQSDGKTPSAAATPPPQVVK